jgi:hypothetical protein
MVMPCLFTVYLDVCNYLDTFHQSYSPSTRWKTYDLNTFFSSSLTKTTIAPVAVALWYCSRACSLVRSLSPSRYSSAGKAIIRGLFGSNSIIGLLSSNEIYILVISSQYWLIFSEYSSGIWVLCILFGHNALLTGRCFLRPSAANWSVSYDFISLLSG